MSCCAQRSTATYYICISWSCLSQSAARMMIQVTWKILLRLLCILCVYPQLLRCIAIMMNFERAYKNNLTTLGPRICWQQLFSFAATRCFWYIVRHNAIVLDIYTISWCSDTVITTLEWNQTYDAIQSLKRMNDLQCRIYSDSLCQTCSATHCRQTAAKRMVPCDLDSNRYEQSWRATISIAIEVGIPQLRCQ